MLTTLTNAPVDYHPMPCMRCGAGLFLPAGSMPICDECRIFEIPPGADQEIAAWDEWKDRRQADIAMSGQQEPPAEAIAPVEPAPEKPRVLIGVAGMKAPYKGYVEVNGKKYPAGSYKTWADAERAAERLARELEEDGRAA